MSELFIVRHGQASFGSDNYDKLSTIGLKQAEMTGLHLVEIGQSFSALYCGTMDRQQKTAAQIQKAYENANKKFPIDCHILESLNEYDSHSVFEKLVPGLIQDEPELEAALSSITTDRRSFQILFEKIMKRWISGKYDQQSLQTWISFKNNVVQGLNSIMTREGAKKRIMVCSSGGPIAIAVQLALGISDEKTMELTWQIQNASITRFVYNQKGEFMLSAFNDTAHLKLTKDNNLLTYR